MEKLSRRSFVTGAAVSALGATIGVSGCAAQKEGGDAGSASGTALDAQDVSWDEEYDFVVVGAGLAGASAAVAVAVEGNGENCLLLEKSPYAVGGGNSPYSGGCVLYTDDSNLDGCIQYLKDLRGDFDTTPDEVLEVYARYLKENLEFIKSLGAKEEDYYVEPPGQLNPPDPNGPTGVMLSCWPEYPEFESSKSVGMVRFKGEEISSVSKFMLSVVEHYPDVITQKTEAPAKSLVQDESTKAIVGVIYEEGDRQIAVKANKAVIMCCGGFESNPTMKQDYLSAALLHPQAGVFNTGDGFDMCQRVGARFWHMNQYAGCWTSPVTADRSKYASPNNDIAWEKGITVGINGRRYYFDVAYGVSLDWQSQQAGGTTLETAVGCRHGHTNYGGEWPHIHQPSRSWFIFDEANRVAALSGLTGKLLSEDIEADGWGFKADTVAELEQKADISTTELEKTIRAWNRDCAEGYDTAFQRPPYWMSTIETPPFYAIRLDPTFINTDGGPVRNANGQVIDMDGNPIPNLYSAGEFGSVWCNMYQGAGNLGECVAFGRIGVRHALGMEV
jgi:succinate dehydrogenase/fumarate reductase flavoprotein subunit